MFTLPRKMEHSVNHELQKHAPSAVLAAEDGGLSVLWMYPKHALSAYEAFSCSGQFVGKVFGLDASRCFDILDVQLKTFSAPVFVEFEVIKNIDSVWQLSLPVALPEGDCVESDRAIAER